MDERAQANAAEKDGRGTKNDRVRIPIFVASGVALVLLLGGALVWHAAAKDNKVTMASLPKPVTELPAKSNPYRAVHTYVGTLRPWIEAKVGPQFISAYVETVLVRPGAVVKKGQVLATLDCRNASAETSALASRAKAIAARQEAMTHEAARTESLLDGGFVSPNEAEQKTAMSSAEQADLAAQQANLSRGALDVSDCILRAPFDGEVSLRLVDPGAFVRPGGEMIGMVDRSTVRMTADAPESDFDSLTIGAKVTIEVIAIKETLSATITRRAPSADPGTRTVHFEVDLPNGDWRIPVDTTAEIHIPVGEPKPATSVPLSDVTMNDVKATLFTVESGVAHSHTLVEMGEVGPNVFFDPLALKPGTMIVTEGRALLNDGDRVEARLANAEPTDTASAVVREAKGKETTP
jgi:membrane fusion protein, multidrug efflux system